MKFFNTFLIFFFIFIFRLNAQSTYIIDNFDNDNSQWDQQGVSDGAWWDAGNPQTYKIGITNINPKTQPGCLWVEYHKQQGYKNHYFQVDLTQDNSNYKDWLNENTGENALMSIAVRSNRPNTKIQFQLCTGPATNYWSNWSESYNLAETNRWYSIQIQWNYFNNITQNGKNDFNDVRRMNIIIDPDKDTTEGTVCIDNFCSLDATVPSVPSQTIILKKLDSLKSYFGTSIVPLEEFLDTVLKKTFNFFLDSNAINLTYGLPRTGYDPTDITSKTWSNPTEWGYYLNALIAGHVFNYISSQEFKEKTEVTLNTIRNLQLDGNENVKGQFYTYYYVKDFQGKDIRPTYDTGQKWLPSIDNAFLTGSLIILREYIKTKVNELSLSNLADSIIYNMDYRIYWNSEKKLFSHAYIVSKERLSDFYWDVYANETPYLSLIAYMLKDINKLEYEANLNRIIKDSGWYKDKDDFAIVVENCNWDGSLFTYFIPYIQIKTEENLFGENSAIPAIIAQMLWAKDHNLQYFGWSDIMASDKIEGGAPPSLHRTQIGWEEEISVFSNIAPYSFFLPLNLKSELETSPILNGIIDICMHKAYQLYQSNVWSNNYDNNIDFGYFIRSSKFGVNNARYFGTLDQFYILGSIFNYFDDFRQYFTTIVEESNDIPRNFILFQNYPNPFNSRTTIRYVITKPTHVKIEIYNMAGQLVEVLINAQKTIGTYYINWNAGQYSSGLYICNFSANGVSAYKKIVLLK